MSAGWHDAAEYGDIGDWWRSSPHNGSPYWRMAGRNDLVTAGERAYALAEPGRQYIVYAAVGGIVGLDLATDTYHARRYDPCTGEAFAPPEGVDRVLYLAAAPTGH